MILKTQSLPSATVEVILDKATEYPFTGEYDDFDEPGTYLCRQCGLALFRSLSKFHAGCGWASFNEQIPGAVTEIPDPDGRRTEILCARCKGHLGHVFHGEGYTGKDIRHCVNSVSLDFVPNLTIEDTEEAIFAAGCFWGVEYYFQKLPGIIKTQVGYTGGHKNDPTYEEVCSGNTGHVEAIRVVFDPKKVSYEEVVKYFFEIHDPTQADGQGPDLGDQYLSAVFYYDAPQKNSVEKLVSALKTNGYDIKTKISPVRIFWPAEDYHQAYYAKNDKQPYCHHYVKRFKE